MSTLTGWDKMFEVEAPTFDDDGKPLYWATTATGRKLRPHWDRSFDDNWEAWGDEFILECQCTENMGENVEHLSKMRRKDFKGQLKTVTWKSYVAAWKTKGAGSVSDKRVDRNIKSAMRNRSVAVSVCRLYKS